MDPYRRKTVYHYLDRTKFPRITIYTVGTLDYHSEGIILLTNNPDLANSTEFSQSRIQRKYEIRVNGRVTSRFIEEIRKGLVCLNKKYKPMYVWTNKKKPKSKNV